MLEMEAAALGLPQASELTVQQAALWVCRSSPVQEKRDLKVVLTFSTILKVFWCSGFVFEKNRHRRLAICIAVLPLRQGQPQWMEQG